MAVDISQIKGGGKKRDGGKPVQIAVKFKLTKEQELYVKSVVLLEQRILLCRDYITLWLGFFRFLADDITARDITSDEEKQFFQVMTQLARKHFLFVEMMGSTFDRGNDIVGVLTMAVSLAHIQVMNENTRGKLELDWHSLYLDMNKSLGRLLRQLPGNMTLSQALEQIDQLAAGATADKAKAGLAKKASAK